MKKLIVAAVMLIMSLCAHAQTSPPTIKALNYEQTMEVGQKFPSSDPVWKNLTPWVGQVATMDGKQVYTFQGHHYKLIFNPVSFASFYATTVPQGLKDETSRRDNNMEIGATWKTVFISPPPPGGECATDSRYQYTFKVVRVDTGVIVLNGKETQTPLVILEGRGWWNSCGWSGKMLQHITYSSMYDIIVQQEVLHFDPSSQLRLGRAIFLKSIVTE